MRRQSNSSPSKKSKSKKNRKGKLKPNRIKVPIEFDEKSEHIQLASQVEVTNYPVDEQREEEDEETKYNKKQTEVHDKYWDEVEMKHHGLVDDHAHHKDHDVPTVVQPTPSKKLPTPGPIPFDELEMKHSGYVDDHCHHLTQNELENDHGEENEKKHVQFDTAVSPIASSTKELSDSEKEEIAAKPEQEDKKLKLEPNVDTVQIDCEEQYSEPTPPWDEFEMKDHGLVDKKGHHKKLPEDDYELHRKGQIDEYGNKMSKPKPIHKPFDEVAMKQSGFVDDHCHHMALDPMHEPTPTSPGGRHIDFAKSSPLCKSDSSMKTAASISVDMSSDLDLDIQEESKFISTKPKHKRKRKGIYRVKITGIINITEKKSNGCQP